jgi:hypothetical protein
MKGWKCFLPCVDTFQQKMACLFVGLTFPGSLYLGYKVAHFTVSQTHKSASRIIEKWQQPRGKVSAEKETQWAALTRFSDLLFAETQPFQDSNDIILPTERTPTHEKDHSFLASTRVPYSMPYIVYFSALDFGDGNEREINRQVVLQQVIPIAGFLAFGIWAIIFSGLALFVSRKSELHKLFQLAMQTTDCCVATRQGMWIFIRGSGSCGLFYASYYILSKSF